MEEPEALTKRGASAGPGGFYELNLETCPVCQQGRLRIIAALPQGQAIRAVLENGQEVWGVSRVQKTRLVIG